MCFSKTAGFTAHANGKKAFKPFQTQDCEENIRNITSQKVLKCGQVIIHVFSDMAMAIF